MRIILTFLRMGIHRCRIIGFGLSFRLTQARSAPLSILFRLCASLTLRSGPP